MREYLLYCVCCDEYTSLGRYVEKRGHFEGEYSLLHNQRMNSDELLRRFLLCHVGHPLKAIANGADEYLNLIQHSSRFKDDEIDKFVEESMQRQREEKKAQLMERELGRLQLNVLYEMLREEAEVIAKLPTETKAEAQYLLGKEDGIKRAIALLQNLMEKTNQFYG